MRLRASLAGLGAATLLALSLASPSPAGAYYANAADVVEGAQLVSADYARLEQGDDATRFAAISADGRYVAIQTRSRNLFADDDPDPPGEYRGGGVFRFDLQSRALVKVADGDLFRESDNAFLRRGASNPSISADGRFVAFSSGQRLVPADTNDNVDVYVRDMDRLTSEAGAYRLVSARDGGEVVANYAPPPFPAASSPGAEVSPGVAISADGSRVAFRTEAASDLPARATADAAAGQIFVRDLNAATTTLVTAVRDGGSELMTAEPAGGGLGTALSADGTTVAWTGRNAAAQTRFLSGENTDPAFNYFLWRRAPFGPEQQTRRITGLADPDDPICRQMEEADPSMVTNFNPNATGPCFGPLTDQEGNRSDITAQVPALSGDGYAVAFLSGAGPRPVVQSGPGLDLYLTDMRPGLSRKQSTTELTRDSPNGDLATSSPLGSVAMSTDGRYLALSTSRTKFTLPTLALVGSSRVVPGPQELYVVDLQARTLERATHSTSGGDVDGGVQDGLTIAADGSRVAFSSFAGNLFRGDSNQRADAFIASRVLEPAPGPPAGGEADGFSTETVSRGGPRVSVRAKAKASGVVVLTISVPAAGAIAATAKARVGDPPKQRSIASRTTKARGKGSFHVVMRAAARFRPALRGGKTVKARIRVTFTPAAGGRKLHASTVAPFG
ncbi:MAG: PD40 domain-containing protein [Thermoleophilia bacterium]|nr:PD40 domain-containing protein [Thermoleophilia bacterium]